MGVRPSWFGEFFIESGDRDGDGGSSVLLPTTNRLAGFDASFLFTLQRRFVASSEDKTFSSFGLPAAAAFTACV